MVMESIDYGGIVAKFRDPAWLQRILEINPGEVQEYKNLQQEFSKGNILENLEFQKRFRQFYRLNNARLSQPFVQIYFKLMQDFTSRPREIKITEILEKLLAAGGKFQFSFATKLAHTVNVRLPIYDSFVGIVLDGIIGYSRTKSWGTSPTVVKERLKYCDSVYDKLKVTVARLEGDCQKSIASFREKFGVPQTEDVSNCKVMDFMLWSLGKHL